MTIDFDGEIRKQDLFKPLHKPLINDQGNTYNVTPLSLKRTWDKMDTIRKKLAKNGEQLTLADLRKTSGPHDETYIMRATRQGHFTTILETLEESGEKLAASDLLATDKNRRSVFEIVSKQDLADKIFNADYWAGREKEFVDFWKELPAWQKSGYNFTSLQRDIALSTIRQAFNDANAANDTNIPGKNSRKNPRSGNDATTGFMPRP